MANACITTSHGKSHRPQTTSFRPQRETGFPLRCTACPSRASGPGRRWAGSVLCGREPLPRGQLHSDPNYRARYRMNKMGYFRKPLPHSDMSILKQKYGNKRPPSMPHKNIARNRDRADFLLYQIFAQNRLSRRYISDPLFVHLLHTHAKALCLFLVCVRACACVHIYIICVYLSAKRNKTLECKLKSSV